MSSICRMILRLFGWKVSGHERLQPLKQYVIIVAPHTSNWDFPLGLLVRKGYGMDKVRYLGKSALFRPPYGWIFRALGGYPVERSKSNNMVGSYIDVFRANPDFAIVLAPEGTRRKVEHFKTGFYFIAKGAGIPIIPCVFDWSLHEVRFLEPYYTGDDPEKEIAFLENLFRGVKGKNPENGF